MIKKVCAILVAYNPNLMRLAAVLTALNSQVDKILIVDNCSFTVDAIARLAESFKSCMLIKLDQNFGIGIALNNGVRIAKGYGYELVLLMDQDSIPSPAMVTTLQRNLYKLQDVGHKVAAIGPRFLDKNSGEISSHIVFSRYRFRRVECKLFGEPLAVDFLITSGSLVFISALDAVGPFDNNLFIDHIDTEWILRAKSTGYRVFGDCTAIMEHDLGEYRRKIWFGRWRDVPIHKPFRYYYIFRNSIWLHNRRYTPSVWKHADLSRLLFIFIFMAIFHPQRLQALRMMSLGLYDGFRGKLGKARFS